MSEHLYDSAWTIRHVQALVEHVVIDCSDPNRRRLLISTTLRQFLIETGWRPPVGGDTDEESTS
jgi:hypothetical protein